jgi:hypothetical protein
MLGDAQRRLRYIIILVYIIIRDIDDATADTEINDGFKHISGDAMTRNLWK